MGTPFDAVDYRAWLDGSRESAAVVVPHLLRLVAPQSVVDVGCGLGAWLAVLAEHGVEDVHGVDGPWVDAHLLEIPAAAYEAVDLHEPLALGRRFDLALCLEVAQLLPPAVADQLVRSLVGLADVVVFSAAIPGQGGIGHVNEQWPRHWAGLFASHGYVATDPIRARVWDEPDVKWWFAQNTACYVAAAALERYPALQVAACEGGSPRSLVHPGCLRAVLERTEAAGPPARPTRRPWRRG